MKKLFYVVGLIVIVSFSFYSFTKTEIKEDPWYCVEGTLSICIAKTNGLCYSTKTVKFRRCIQYYHKGLAEQKVKDWAKITAKAHIRDNPNQGYSEPITINTTKVYDGKCVSNGYFNCEDWFPK